MRVSVSACPPTTGCLRWAHPPPGYLVRCAAHSLLPAPLPPFHGPFILDAVAAAATPRPSPPPCVGVGASQPPPPPLLSGSFYGREPFDPLLILAQITLLQFAFYAALAATTLTLNALTGVSTPLHYQLFSPDAYDTSAIPGYVSIAAFLLTAAAPVPAAYVAVVGRARRAADFAATVYLGHAVAVGVYGGEVPRRLGWWAVMVGGGVIAAVVAGVAAMRLEMREIGLVAPSLTARDEEAGVGGGGGRAPCDEGAVALLGAGNGASAGGAGGGRSRS